MHITGFVEKRLDGVAQRTTEFFWLQRSNHPILEPFEDIIRELVEVPAVPAIESSDETCEVECVVAHRADPVLSQPVPAALDGDTGMKSVVDGISEQLVR